MSCICTFDIPCHIEGDTTREIGFQVKELVDSVYVVKDITGATIESDFYLSDAITPALELSVGSGITLSDPVNGAFQFDQGWGDGLTEGLYNHSLSVTLSGVRDTVYKGTYQVIKP